MTDDDSAGRRVWGGGRRLLRAWNDHRTGRNVTVVTHFVFMAALPGLFAISSVFALVTRFSDMDLGSLENGVFGRVPLIGAQLRAYAEGRIAEEVGTLVAGILLALWASIRALSSVMDLNDDIWEVPVSARLGPGRRRLRALGSLLRLGGGFLLATAAAASVLTPLPAAAGATGLVVAGAVNVAAVTGLLRLSSRRPSFPEIRRGAILGGAAFTLLQLGGAVVMRAMSGEQTGPLGPTFALIAWLGLHAMALAVSAETCALSARARDLSGLGIEQSGEGVQAVPTEGPGVAGHNVS